MKKILAPIDFRIESLITLKKGLDSIEEPEVDVTLMYAENLSDSITHLLFYSPKRELNEKNTSSFHEALTILKNRYEKKITYINIELFHGYGYNAMDNFLDARKIDQIFIPLEYKLRPLKNGFDPISLLRKSKIPIVEVSWSRDTEYENIQQLSNLFM